VRAPVSIQRLGRMATLRPGAEEEYDRLHAAVWPEMLEAIRRAGNGVFAYFPNSLESSIAKLRQKLP
jgi:L-rhamnose mutarotase